MPEWEIFQRRPSDDAYRAWLIVNPDGYVLNVDEPQSWSKYPKIHTAQCKAISSNERKNYTTGKRYYKVCANSISALEKYAEQEHGKNLTYCRYMK